ncbi:large conductance mechanosensitive channel protein MscL [Ectobacillus panaciterrae]|uniref:large conductance mechanosensitive channel protein MscL n=1 Tax=Ectobacillus panaciterrae TaxID=363872 RepID=UPI00040A250E|nr:large conductance mechanosensitive channel protein MscL [Ectobacillus panaciterrae]
MWNDFKKFALKGNVFDLAVGVIIGAAFGKIVTSLVSDIIMPIVGLLLGKVSFADLKIEIGNSVIKYGSFIQTVVDFFIVAFSIFLFIRLFQRLKKKEEVQEKQENPKPSREEELLAEIRDLLKTSAAKDN